ncbi:hypothetical protein GGE06_001355 [Streptomyces sp. SFB5A]|uniref:Uncharacterized protein n=1 Tax=Streptomyces nymphaeiformis TaxID=2663842 RepID=A0A7W7XA06_9ACTN|nr:hypothetical protein [Streptomyces nymphaeiformis]
MLAVLLRVVRLVRADPVDRDQGAVDDDMVALAEAGEGFMKAGRPGSQDLQGLVDVSPGGGLGYPETGSELRERLVLPQMDQREQRLLEAAELAPAGVAGPAMLVQKPGDMLDVPCGMSSVAGYGNLQGLFGRRCAEWNHHANDEGPCLVTTPADQPKSPSSTG